MHCMAFHKSWQRVQENFQQVSFKQPSHNTMDMVHVHETILISNPSISIFNVNNKEN